MSRIAVASVFHALLVLGMSPVLAQDAAGSGEHEIDHALRNRRFGRAVELIDAALAGAKPESREYLMFRRGVALLYAEKYADAIAQFDRQLTDHADGAWAHKAALRKADAHVALRQFEAAERIYAERVRELVGDGRKARIARVYLDFAEEFFKPTDSLSSPDYAKALKFYGRALEIEPGEDLRDEILYKLALCHQKMRKWSEAANQYDAYLTTFDPTYRELRKLRSGRAPLPAAASRQGRHLVEARLGLGESRLAMNRHADARRVFQNLLALIDSIDAGDDKHGPTWIKATYQLARTHRMPAPPNGESLALGVQALERLLTRYAESKKAIQGAYEIGVAYAHLGRHDQAIAAFGALIQRDKIRPANDKTRELAEKLSQQALFDTGNLYFAQKKYADAIGAWNQYVAKYPTGPHWSASQQRIVDADFQIGADAIADERYDDARAAWTAFLQKYPLDGRAAAILYKLGDVSFTEQKVRADAGQAPDWNAPIAQWRRLVNKFPNTEDSGHAQYRIGRTLETRVHDLEAAIEAYKKLTWSQWAGRAKQRTREMKAVRLSLWTERTFHTDETPQVRVDARNIETLTVKMYRVDMEDYYRKSHGMRGVEELDLLLIDPDRTFDVPLEDFANYKPVTRKIDIPFEGPGVYAVYVSNENSKARLPGGGAPKRVEATTLLIRSDIDVIIKTSRRQVLVFAQNMRTGRAAAGVRVLASDGRKVFLEGKTGDDGAWLRKSSQLHNVATLSVFAEVDGHVAGNALSLSGLEFSRGLEPKGYIYTDRPTYRPGEAVNIRGILREVKMGQYALPASPEEARLQWKLDVVDAKGRVLHTEPVTPSAFGSFATQFRIAADAPVGDYKLIVRRVQGPTYSGGFKVQTYQLSKAYLKFDFDERVVMRGTPIKGAIVAQYHYGEAVVGKTIEYEMTLPAGDVIRRSGVTDKEGKVPFAFESTALPEEGAVQLTARQADLDIGAADRVFVAVRAFRAEVATVRPLVLSDEPVEVTVTTKDLAGKPIAEEMTLIALRRTRDKGRWTETKVETVAIATDAETGRGRASLKLTQGGDYVLRAEGKDKFDHLVSAETTVKVSDDKDKTRVRIFSDRQHYKVGEAIGLDVHSRIDRKTRPDNSDEPASLLALVTYEGEEIIGYRTLDLAEGHNRFDLPVKNEHFPNFAVGVAVMAGNKFHTASRAFTVERQLHIAVKPDKKAYRPRDEMTLEIEVTDQQGRPVEGEVGIVMIDNALLTRYPDPTPNIVAFFQEGAKRSAEMRTQTSCTFEYRAKTRDMVTELLAEARRMEEAEVEILAAGQPMGGRPASGEDRFGVLFFDIRSDINANGSAERGALARPGVDAGGRGQRGRVRGLTNAPAQPAATATAQSMSDVSLFAMVRPHDADPQGAYDFLREKDRSFAYQLEHDKITLGRALQKRIDGLNTAYLGGSIIVEGKQLDAKMASLVQNAPPRTYFPEVAYWNPRVVTDADGKATVRVVIPDSSTTWKIIARGITKETLAGRGDAEIVSRHDFFVEVVMPATLVEGDKVTPRARVHCLTPYSGKIDVEMKARRHEGTKARSGEVVSTQTRSVEVDGAGVIDVMFDPIDVASSDDLVIEITATTAEAVPDAQRRLTDAVAQDVPVRPWGMRVERHAAGVAKDSDFVEIELPATNGKRDYHDVHMTVAVGPSMQRWLIEEALERGHRWRLIERHFSSWRVAPPRTHADTASALIGCLYVTDYVRGLDGGPDGSADMSLLDDRVAGLVAQLLAAQNDDGGWLWCGKGQASDPWVSAHVAWALGKARHDGHAIADGAVRKLSAYLKKAFADARPNQTELKAIVLHGVSWISTADFAHANRLFRNRQSLSNAALGNLALTFARLDRESIAAELLGVLEHRLQEVRLGNQLCRKLPCNDVSAWMNSELEVTALALLAQLSVDPDATSVKPMVNFLTAAARADGWRPHKARGTIMAAVATYYARTPAVGANYRLAVSVNGREIKKITSDTAGSVRIDLSADRLRPGKQRVDFAFDGRGEFAYTVTLSGFTPAFPTPRSMRNNMIHLSERYVTPPPVEYKGRTVKAGFGVAARYDHFRNTARNLPVGSVASVDIGLTRFDRSDNAAGDRDYIVVHEAIPAGFRLLTETIRGRHLAYDYADHVLTLYYGSQRHLGALQYKMVATTPGSYRVPPTRMRSLYKPGLGHVNKADQVLTVLDRGANSPDPYRMTPDELYNLARLYYDDADYGSSAEYLTKLLAEDWVLRDKPYRESIRMLLTSALKRDDDEGIVNYFEILKEKHPDLVIPFDDIVRIADAYAKTSQHERAYLIYRATADASFVRDSAVGGALREEGRFLESIDFLENLWREYPDTPQVVSIYFAVSQTLYAQARNPAAVRSRIGADGKTTRVTRASIIRETIRLLDSFLTLYPKSPIADEASYSLANAYLDLDRYEAVVGLSKELCELFPKSKWVGRFRYIQALAYFHLGRFDEARKLAEQVAESTHRDEQGVERPSPNRWLALYIIGQIYHAQNDTPKALEYYKKVKEHFSDANEVVDYFEHKFVKLPEVTVFHPDGAGFREADEWAEHLRNGRPTAAETNGRHVGTDAELYDRPFVKIDYRNIKTAHLQVYRVDLMKLALVEKNLSQITSVNLAGIRPIVEKTVKLGDGHDYVDRTIRVALEATRHAAGDGTERDDATGAYLVICRGDDLFSSGLVLVTPLALEVQEDVASQRVRVNVVNAVSRDGLSDVHVKVIGMGSSKFVSGETDLRGVYVADAVPGYPTAIARDADGHFAFHRSKSVMLAMAAPQGQQLEARDRQARKSSKGKADYRSNLLMDNQGIQDRNQRAINGLFKNQQKGVQIQSAE